jgi:hypothetical protein
MSLRPATFELLRRNIVDMQFTRAVGRRAGSPINQTKLGLYVGRHFVPLYWRFC